MVTEAWPAGSPFLGIAKRPYDQDLVEGITWPDTVPRLVMFEELWLTQHHLSIAALVGIRGYSTDSHPRVVRCDGRFYLEDGHHRVVMLATRRVTGVKARVASLEARQWSIS